MIVIIIVAALVVIMGIIILAGKGDMLIAGYNTASKQERDRYDVKKLRRLTGGVLIVIGLMCLMLLEQDLTSSIAFAVVTFVLAIVTVVLANTWALKK
jgi:uncharacterized membrane protein